MGEAPKRSWSIFCKVGLFLANWGYFDDLGVFFAVFFDALYSNVFIQTCDHYNCDI